MKIKEEKSEDKEIIINLKDREEVEEVVDLEEKEINNKLLNKLKNLFKQPQHDLFIINHQF